MKSNYEFYSSITNAGERVRPGNWMYRIAILASTFDNRKRLNYNITLVPSVYDGQLCLRIDKENLKTNFPGLYENIIEMLSNLDVKKIDII